MVGKVAYKGKKKFVSLVGQKWKITIFRSFPWLPVKLHIFPVSQYLLFSKFPFLFWILFSSTDITSLYLKVRNSPSY